MGHVDHRIDTADSNQGRRKGQQASQGCPRPISRFSGLGSL